MEELENYVYYNIRLNFNTVKDLAVKLYLFNDIDIDAIQGKYLINAKSIMGIFSLDLTKSITLRIHRENTNGKYVNDRTLKQLEDIIRPCII